MSCATIYTVNTPGPAGPPGHDGLNGAAGVSAWTAVLAAGSVMPVEGGSTTVSTTSSTAFLTVGEVAFVQNWGYMLVTATPTATSVTLQNLENTGSSLYLGNAAPGTPLAALSKIVPGGVQGPAGVVVGGLFLLKAQNLSDVADVPTSRVNLGLGTAATYTAGVVSGDIPVIDGAFNNGEAIFATSNGQRSLAASPARTQLGLTAAAITPLGTANGSLATVNDASGLTNGEVVFATATGLESLTPAAARIALGITTGSFDMLLFQHRAATGVSGGGFASGAPVVVPLDTEVVDTGNHGSIAVNQVTLDAGTYRYRFSVVGYEVGTFQGHLYNNTTPGIILNAGPGSLPSYGSVAQTGVTTSLVGISGVSLGEGRFTIAGVTAISLRAQCSGGRVTYGFGLASGFAGNAEVYSWLELTKE